MVYLTKEEVRELRTMNLENILDEDENWDYIPDDDLEEEPTKEDWSDVNWDDDELED